MALELIFAIGIAAFLLLILFNKLDESEHFALRLLLLGFFFFLLILLSKATIDDNDHCTFFIKNATLSVGGNFTNYEYTNICEENTDTTDEQFYINIVRLFWLIMIYIFVFIVWKMLNTLGRIPGDYMARLRLKFGRRKY